MGICSLLEDMADYSLVYSRIDDYTKLCFVWVILSEVKTYPGGRISSLLF